ncbi:MAG: hypothetical protein GXO15_05345, partial [Crenarchaeota archaeon]|nr:hypothetical protein [Thermoproteota archaeon]
LAASVDPYNPALIVAQEPGSNAADAAAAKLAAATGCEPARIAARPLQQPARPASEEEQPG